MGCLICAQKTGLQRSIGDWEERHCATCGHYRISRNFLVLMEIQGLKFNIEETRLWLSTLRRTDPLPGIVAENAICVKNLSIGSRVYATRATGRR
ncbi:MAG: hypothetical protein QOI97_5321 [Pseudomonas sp.]|jgi:hypothetical protein|nr:hypothetical protein [Pseudomonas sp.]